MKNNNRTRRPSRRVSAHTIQGVLALLVLIFVVPNVLLNMINPDDPGEYSWYSGPILPMSSLSGGEGVQVSREVTLDFAIYAEEKEYSFDPERVTVTDTYILNNPGGEAASVELVLGLEGRLTERLPEITVDGRPASAVLWPADALNDGQGGINDFQEYSRALTKNDLLAEAMAEAPAWDETVKVYHFYNLKYEGTEPNPPLLGISYKYSNNTNLWMRTYEMSGVADGREHLYFGLEEDVWLYVVGEDLKDLEAGGSRVHTHGIHTASDVEGVTYELEVYDARFADCLREAAEGYTHEYGDGADPLTPEMRYNKAMKQIAAMDRMPGNSYAMDTCFYKLYEEIRMLYWVIPVEIPAGGSVTVSVAYIKESSHNSEDTRHGYEIAPTLGSNLNFTEQRVTLVNTAPVELSDLSEGQNFGFDLAAGINTVTLDLSVERYFMDLILRE